MKVVRKEGESFDKITVDGEPLASYLEKAVAKEVVESLESEKHAKKRRGKPKYADDKGDSPVTTLWSRGEINRNRNKELLVMARGKSLTELVFTALLSGVELTTAEMREKIKEVDPQRPITKDNISNLMYHIKRRADSKALLVLGKGGKGNISYKLLSSVVEHCTAQELLDLYDKRSKLTLESLCKAHPAIDEELKSKVDAAASPDKKEPAEEKTSKELTADPPRLPPLEITEDRPMLAMEDVAAFVDGRLEAFKNDMKQQGIEVKVTGGISIRFLMGRD